LQGRLSKKTAYSQRIEINTLGQLNSVNVHKNFAGTSNKKSPVRGFTNNKIKPDQRGQTIKQI